ncbi:hypothetical protein QBC35DRAFT_503083 [Podospora australis]|uniref:Heterokaryon incompatibility domain-containing protein n=1 Tax=Podospora australis TaxID=1536484 RepID=A0AAN6WQP1_9PEZI|nr:hypothetical protein QBC35DRAFT_503083 [Podospora australis]
MDTGGSNDAEQIEGVILTPPGAEVIETTRSCGLLPYLLAEGSEDEFRRIYDKRRSHDVRGDSTAACATVINYWINTCSSNHPECSMSVVHKSGLHVPRRLVDLGNSATGDGLHSLPTTVSIFATNGQNLRYVAVSYRWPREESSWPKLTHQTYLHYTAGFPTSLLPIPIRDACMAAKRLGIRYLWVDSMCIVHGPGGDFHLEAPKMASVYGNAFLSIAFTDNISLRKAAAASGGLFLSNCNVEDTKHERAYTQDDPESIYTWLESSGNFPCRPEGELDIRGWAFQERLLSLRVLSITEKGIFWDCLRLSACDWRPIGFMGDFSPRFRDTEERKLKFLLFGQPTQEHLDPYRLWRRLLQQYTTRVFTNPEDRVIAIQGIIRQLDCVVKGDHIVFGLLGDNLQTLRSLIWFVEPKDEKVVAMRENPAIIAPSWVWASVPAPIQYRLWHPWARSTDLNEEILTPCAVVDSMSIQQWDPTSFTGFNGSVVLKGPLASINVTKLLNKGGCKFILDPRPWKWYSSLGAGVTMGSERSSSSRDEIYEPDFKEQLWGSKPDHLTVFLVLEGGYSVNQQAQYCLILKSCQRHNSHHDTTTECAERYQRVGVLVVDKAMRTFCANDPDVCRDPKCRLDLLEMRGDSVVNRICEGKTHTICVI